MKTPALVLSSILVIAISGTAIASQHESGKNRCTEERMTNWIARTDTDKDGKLSSTEIDGMRVRSIDRADKDGDGGLNLEEYKTAGRKPKGPGAEKQFAMIDADKNGKISPEENAAYNRNKTKMLDTDKDGFVSVQEMVASCTPKPPKE